jgi:ABC-2 type transport system ATP-binding protein
MNELLSVRNLERRYGELRVLAGVDLRLERGEVMGLLGPNGAGKTTCLQIISGNLAPSSGDIRVLGVDLVRSPLKAKRSIGYLPERPPLYHDMRVDEYLAHCARLHRLSGRRSGQAVMQAKERCGLEDKGRRLIGTLSKGYRQRLGIAQAIVHEPDLVILDEPTEGLDPVQLRAVRELIRTLSADCGVVLSSHMLPEVQAVCTRVSILRDGRVLHQTRLERQAGEPRLGRYIVRLAAPPGASELSAIPGVAAVQSTEPDAFRITLRPGEDPAELARRLVEPGWGLIELRPDRTDLERVFFDILGGEQAA